MRLIISTFILCLLSLKMFGQQKQPQTEQLHPKFSEAYCPSAQVLVKSVIFYENYAKVYLAFEEVIVGQQVLITSLDKEYQQTFLLYSNELLVDNIPNGKLYEIEVKDACGDYVSIAFFTTRVEDIETHGIEVSNRMFKAITVFQKQKNNLPLTDFLRDLKTVSPYEKIAFIQQYFLDSRPFTKDEGTKLPEVTLLEKGGEECLCKFVFNTTQRATPAIVTADGKLKHVHEESVNSNGGIKIPWDSDSRYWWYRNTMGPSKWHYLWSEGWEAGGTDREVSYNVLSGLDGESQPSPHMAELAYNFVCTNYQELPRECECEKEIRLNWGYESRVVAEAKLTGSSPWDRSAFARTQDMALVTMTMGQELTMLDAGEMAVQAACSSGLNSEWFVELVDVALYAYLTYASLTGNNTSVTTTTPIVTQLADEIQDLLDQNTPLYEYGDCESLTLDGTLVNEIDERVPMPPNTPLYLNMYSFSNQGVGGKRKWFSYSGIESGFYLAGVVRGGKVLGGDGTPGPEACCTDQIGNWIYGSQSTVPNHKQSMHDGASQALAIWQPWENLPLEPFTNLLKLPSEVGFTSTRVGCEDIKPEGKSQFSVKVSNDILSDELLSSKGNKAISDNVFKSENKEELDEEVIVFDINGRILYQGILPNRVFDFRIFLIENAIIQNTGLYFIHSLKSNGEKKTSKIFIQK